MCWGATALGSCTVEGGSEITHTFFGNFLIEITVPSHTPPPPSHHEKVSEDCVNVRLFYEQRNLSASRQPLTHEKEQPHRRLTTESPNTHVFVLTLPRQAPAHGTTVDPHTLGEGGNLSAVTYTTQGRARWGGGTWWSYEFKFKY